MQMKAALLMGNPCDEEEDDLALLCAQGTGEALLLLSRAPGEEDIEVVWDEHSALVRDIKVTLSAQRLLVDLPAEAEAPFSAARLTVDLKDALMDLDEAQEALRVILDGTGTLVME